MIHLIPRLEFADHVPSLTCWCEPDPQFADARGIEFPRGPLVVHGDAAGVDLDTLKFDGTHWEVVEEAV